MMPITVCLCKGALGAWALWRLKSFVTVRKHMNRAGGCRSRSYNCLCCGISGLAASTQPPQVTRVLDVRDVLQAVDRFSGEWSA
jgi:hypothetical protein